MLQQPYRHPHLLTKSAVTFLSLLFLLLHTQCLFFLTCFFFLGVQVASLGESGLKELQAKLDAANTKNNTTVPIEIFSMCVCVRVCVCREVELHFRLHKFLYWIEFHTCLVGF